MSGVYFQIINVKKGEHKSCLRFPSLHFKYCISYLYKDIFFEVRCAVYLVRITRFLKCLKSCDSFQGVIAQLIYIS